MPSRARIIQWIGAAIIAGVVLHYVYYSVQPARDRSSPLAQLEDLITAPPAVPTCKPTRPMGTPPPRPQLERLQEGGMDRLEYLREMISKTKGYYVRDWSLGLGWNNMRYIIEASLMHATVLNRTLVLPSFVYARACEHPISVCAEYAFMVNRGDAIGWNDWRELPLDQQMGWRIPMEIMLNVTHMRTKYNVITFHDYLDLHNLSRTIEWGSGAWDRNGYHNAQPHIAMFVIPNVEFDPFSTVRVDTYPDTGKEIMVTNAIMAKRLKEALGEQKQVLDWEDAKRVLVESNDEAAMQALKDAGWVQTHTFAPILGMEFVKSPVTPLIQVAPHISVRGLLEDWGQHEEEVMLLEGETHLNRKPGSLRFMSAEARDDYMTLCLRDLQIIDKLQVIADRIIERMAAKVDGRMWMGAQMRRGDFARLGWAMEHDVPSHYERVQDRLKKGRMLLEKMVRDKDQTVFDIPDAYPDPAVLSREPPHEGDPVYIATDERDSENLDYLRAHGAILIGDLMTFEDRQIVGWPLLITDVLALVEQLVLARSEFFYGHAMSSVAGGIVNMRAARGADPRTHLID